jgi:predicted DCC family thiol-disulfide oxidoreductase YuxK
MSTKPSDARNSNSVRTESNDYTVEVFFDGGCPLCLREINMLRRWDRKNRIRFTDIDAPEFHAEVLGKTQDDLMAHIQGRLADGTWIRGVEVFRELYSAVGLGWLVQLTRLPVLSHMLDWGYSLFAKNRLRLTGRCDAAKCSVDKTRTIASPAKLQK